MAATESALGRVSGVTLSPAALEAEFRARNLQHDGRVAAAVITVMTLLTVPFIASDVSFVGDRTALVALLCARAIFIVASAAVAWAAWRARRATTLDSVVLLWLVAVAAEEVAVQSTRPHGYLLPLINTVMALSLAWLVLPNRYSLQAAGAAAITASAATWVMLFRDPLTDIEGRLVGAVGVFFNLLLAVASLNVHRVRRFQFLAMRTAEHAVARLQQRDAELALSQGRFRTMADSAPVLIWLTGPDHGCTWVNQQSLQFTGRTLEQELGDGWLEAVHPEDRARCREVYRSHFDSRAPFSSEYRLRRRDGEYRWVLNTGRPLVLETGAFAGYVGSSVDITDRREAEARSKQSEEQLAAVIEGSRAGYLDIDLVNGTAHRSPRYWEIVGWPEHALPATPFAMRELVHPDDAPRNSEVIAGLTSGTLVHCDEDFRVRTKDGRWVWVKALLKVIDRDASGKPTRIAGTITDAQESHQRQAQALESARLHGLSDRMNETELLIGLDGVIVEANDRAHTLYQKSRAELIGHSVSELRVPGSAPALETVLRTATETGTRYETQHRRSDDSTFPVEVSARLVKANGTSFLHFLVRDLTAQRAAERTLMANEERLRTVVASMAEGLVMHDASGAIVSCNPAAERILGLSRAQLEGRSSIDPRWRAIKEDGAPFPGEEHPAMVTLRTGQPLRGVMMGVHQPDGAVSWVSISSEPLRLTPESPPYAVVVTFNDLTQRKKDEDALKATLADNQRLVADLKEAALKVKTLSGLLPICMHCKKIRDDAGYWERIESYITTHSGALFTHGVCPECFATHYPEADDDPD